MKRFRVEFFKHLLDTYGRHFKTLQGKLEVEAESPAEAEMKAERQFERQRDISDWHIRADTVETKPAKKRVARDARHGPGKGAGRPHP
jgi:hypothetical protein